MKRKLIALALGLGLLAPAFASAEVKDPLLQKLVDKGTLTGVEAEEIESKRQDLPKALQGLSVGGLFYVDYSFGRKNQNGTNFNQFSLTRGYINIRKDIAPWMKARITPDITQDSTGDWKLRMKYLYADFLPPSLGPFTENAVRAGLGHTPWLDFQEHINIYRMQGVMFQERFGLFNSADTGVGILGNLGGTLGKDAQDEVGYHSPYSGRYGSYHVGVYNGGGYHAAENNQDKVVEGRLSVRPLPDIVPGLQLSYLGINGKGNTSAKPEWSTNAGLISYQNRYLAATAEYASSKGQQNGADEKDKSGYSLFADFRPPFYDKASVFARYDVWDPDTKVDDNRQFLSIIGAAYRIYGSNYLMAAFEKTHYQQAGLKDDRKGQVVLQISF